MSNLDLPWLQYHQPPKPGTSQIWGPFSVFQSRQSKGSASCRQASWQRTHRALACSRGCAGVSAPGLFLYFCDFGPHRALPL